MRSAVPNTSTSEEPDKKGHWHMTQVGRIGGWRGVMAEGSLPPVHDCGVRKKKRRVKVLLGGGCFALILAGCVSGSGEFQWHYHEQYTLSQKNRQALMNLRPGMSQNEVREVMGEPQMVEGYPRETVWYYRTAATSFESNTALDTTATQRSLRVQDLSTRSGRDTDTNFTPLVFDDRQRLVAWGRDAALQGRVFREGPVLSLP
jgi:SmpA / OmlA family